MLIVRTLLPLLIFSLATQAQSYISYRVGAATDLVSEAQGGVCLMGGATESDPAMSWFLERASGGDVLVLRADNSDGYNDYLFSDLGVTLNSVETIVFNNASAANEAYVQQRISHAEAIWVAGGDQWEYIQYWRNTPVDSLINLGIQNRNLAIGGISAGMAIMGQYYFSAQNGTVNSTQAMTNPYNNKVTVSKQPFLQNTWLSNIITDTHFDNPEREGRLATFIARVLQDENVALRAIACDEYTSVCIDPTGLCRIFGDYPAYNDNVYFVQANCEIPDNTPENCESGSTLTWNQEGAALAVYQIKGTEDGTQTFDLNDWFNSTSGTWLNWSVMEGEFFATDANAPECEATGLDQPIQPDALHLYPNPVTDQLIIRSEQLIQQVQILNGAGQVLHILESGQTTMVIPFNRFESGLYFIRVIGEHGSKSAIVVKL